MLVDLRKENTYPADGVANARATRMLICFVISKKTLKSNASMTTMIVCISSISNIVAFF